ncbi:MAG: prefoldin subunit alpha [Nanoarchaeota archaeon]
MNQELLKEAAGLHQEVERLEQHVGLMENEIVEMDKFHGALSSIGSPSEKNVLAPLGKGIFASAKIDSNELFVEVGAGIIVKKNPEEVKEIVESRIESLQKSKTLISQQIELKFSALQEIIQELEKQR